MANTKTTRQHDTTGASEYCKEVASGRIVVGQYVALACEQHQRDLVDGHKRGLYWDEKRANHILKFFPDFLVLSEEVDGEPFELQLWQQFIVGVTRGWQQRLGNGIQVLRYRVCYTEIGKGNGKTPIMAGICTYGLVASRTSQPEIYLAASGLDQAKIPFADCTHQAEGIIAKHPEWKRRIEIQAESIRVKTGKRGFIRPVSSSFRGLSGQRVYIGAIDELHEHPNDLVLGRIKRGTKGRKQAQIFMITNSGDDVNSTCGQQRKAAIINLENGCPNPNLFAYICTLDEGDDGFKDEECWIKTNPNLDVPGCTPSHYIRELVEGARSIPREEADVRRFCFCEWVGSENPAFDMAKWDDGQTKETIDDIPAGDECFIGIDLAAKIDLTALVSVFKTEREFEDKEGNVTWKRGWKAYGTFWIPEDSVHRLKTQQSVEIQKWIDDGIIITTPGARTDHSYIIKKFKELYKYFTVKRLGYDPYNIGNTDNDIKKWIEKVDQEVDPEELVIELTQSISTLNWGTKELQASIAEYGFDTGGCPVLKWMAANSTLRSDDNGNCMVSKKNSKGKIDGVAAAIFGITVSQSFVSEDDEPEDDESYDDAFVIDMAAIEDDDDD